MLAKLNMTVPPVDLADDFSNLWNDVAAACNRVPPLWDLANYVAVNPFLGFASTPIAEATSIVEEGLAARVLPGLDFYREKWRKGELGDEAIQFAALRVGVDGEALRSVLSNDAQTMAFREVRLVQTFSERCDNAHGTSWRDYVNRSIARWCAVYAADGGTQWSDARQGKSLFASWIEAARVDRSLEIIGLGRWRAFMRQVPDDPKQAIEAMMVRLAVPQQNRIAYFYRLLGNLYGWASYFRRSSWQEGSDEPREVGELLAILACADAAVAEVCRKSHPANENTPVESESVRLALQEAVEDQYVNRLIRSLNPSPTTQRTTRPAVQAIFCIDVRSEPLRRNLELQSELVETLGFAGFFGVSLDWQASGEHSARCPVLLKPSFSLKSSPVQPTPFSSAATNYLQSAPSAAFSYVEMVGIFYGIKLTVDALTLGGRGQNVDHVADYKMASDGTGYGLSLDDQIDLAAGILKNTGLGTDCARIVLLCGHEGHSANNPHAAGLDCGACGGHGGAINARVAANLLNFPQVRKGLARRGIMLPDDTHFMPAVHDTSSDRVTFLDVERIPSTHAADLITLRKWFDQASAMVRQERAPNLRVDEVRPTILDKLLLKRSKDWSEVRPEWGLARNAAFIAARRVRSRQVNLDGRAFLHEYDAASDPDGSVLTLILSAPMVVASWINLQYFASTVDNEVFGSGNKALHNRIGSLGVVLGNGGDLRTGLPLQSVYGPDGTYHHEPLRLQVVVEASCEQIDAVVKSQKSVKDLVDNGWVRLFSIDPDSQTSYRCLPGGGWEAMRNDLPIDTSSTSGS